MTSTSLVSSGLMSLEWISTDLGRERHGPNSSHNKTQGLEGLFSLDTVRPVPRLVSSLSEE